MRLFYYYFQHCLTDTENEISPPVWRKAMDKQTKAEETLAGPTYQELREDMKAFDNCKEVLKCTEALRCIKEWKSSSSYAELQMPAMQFNFWFDAIKENNSTLVEEILSRCDEQEKRLLLDGHFQFHNQCLLKSTALTYQNLTCTFELPLFLAVHFQSIKVLKIMFQSGIDISQNDFRGNNVIHGLVLSSSSASDKNYRSMYAYLMKSLSTSDKKRLLLAENNDGLRPLEYASKLDEFGLQECILQTKDVYAFSKGNVGVYEQVYYDVTDYECIGRGRYLKSPLWYMTHLSKESLESNTTRGAILSPVMRSWYKVKEQNTASIIRIWFFFRTLFHIMVVLMSGFLRTIFTQFKYDNHLILNNLTCTDFLNGTQYNLTECEGDFVKSLCQGFTMRALGFLIGCIVLGTSAIIVIVNVTDGLVSLWKTHCNKKGIARKIVSGGSLVSTRFYHVAQFLLALSIVGCAFMIFLQVQFHEHDSRFTQLMHNISVLLFISVILLNGWAMLYFLQFLPHMGYFVLAVQRMVGETFKFIFIFLLFLFGFSEAFANVLAVNGFCHVPEFKDKAISLYSTFTVMLNMINLNEYMQSNFTLGLVHFTYVLMVAVLLLNFLIALMANSMGSVSEYRTVLMTLQRLHISLLLEWKYSRVCCLWYKRKQSQYLVRENGRLYLPCFVEIPF